MFTARPPTLRRAGRRAGAGAALALLLPLLTACSLVGYPSPLDPGPGPRGDGVAGTAPTPGAGSYEVRGRRYAVLASADGYRQAGIASWYGAEFAGRPTASGEIFDPERMTAAHRSLPLSTWVEVINLDNGRSVVVRINDRGPFADVERRIIDLSREAARRLEMIGPGTARVQVRALTAEEAQQVADAGG